VVTGMNLIVIAYILCAGLPFGQLANLAPFAPSGAGGVFAAASIVFSALTQSRARPRRRAPSVAATELVEQPACSMMRNVIENGLHGAVLLHGHANAETDSM